MIGAARLKEEMLTLTALRVEADCLCERDFVLHKRRFFMSKIQVSVFLRYVRAVNLGVKRKE